MPHTPVALKPLVDEEEIVLFALDTSQEGIDPPGWTFNLNRLPACNSEVMLKWIAENDPDFPPDRPARIGGAFWAGPYGESILDGAEDYSMAHPDQYEWVGGYTNYYSFNWDAEVEALKDCDYVFVPTPMHVFANAYRIAGYDAKFVGSRYASFVGIFGWKDAWFTE